MTEDRISQRKSPFAVCGQERQKEGEKEASGGGGGGGGGGIAEAAAAIAVRSFSLQKIAVTHEKRQNEEERTARITLSLSHCWVQD